jgi:hypothetical protein
MNTKTSYDRVADEYVRRIFDELQHKPLDRLLLDRFAASVRGMGPVCDMGCGPGAGGSLPARAGGGSLWRGLVAGDGGAGERVDAGG